MKKERLDKFLSNQLNISRNDARTSIRRGSAAVGGVTVKDAGYLIDPSADEVLFAGEKVRYKEFLYLMMNKPAGIITASADKKRKTVLDLVPPKLRRRELAPVGRLDKDTTGLLILTDDGEFAHRCISPKSEIEKVYIAELDGNIDESIVKEFENGVVLSDGSRLKPARLEILAPRLARVTVTEGKYHQIKRMFGVFSLGVNRLHRESVGNLRLPADMVPGECREIPVTRGFTIC